MSVAIATMGMYGTIGTAGAGTGDPVYVQTGGIGGAGGGVERKKPVVMVSRMIEIDKKKRTSIKIISVDEV